MGDVIYSSEADVDSGADFQQTLEELYSLLEAADERALRAMNLVKKLTSSGELELEDRVDLTYVLLDLMENTVKFKVVFLEYM